MIAGCEVSGSGRGRVGSATGIVASAARSGAAMRKGMSASRIAAAFGQRSSGARAIARSATWASPGGMPARTSLRRGGVVVRRATAVPISVSAPKGVVPVSIS